MSRTAFRVQITLMILSMVLLVAATVGITLALFTDSRESESVFTVGNVRVTLTEAAVVRDSQGNLVKDPTAPRFTGAEIGGGEDAVRDYGMVFPGQSIYKDPTVKNVGTHDAFVAFKVVIEDGAGDIHNLYAYNDERDDIDIKLLLAGGLLDERTYVGDWGGYEDVCYNEHYAMIQASNRSEGRYEFFFLLLDPLAVGEEATVFDTVIFDSYFDNSEMNELRELKITVQAYAVQTVGVDSCLSAMCEAFPRAFGALSSEE